MDNDSSDRARLLFAHRGGLNHFRQLFWSLLRWVDEDPGDENRFLAFGDLGSVAQINRSWF
jgi:hypothetical protein